MPKGRMGVWRCDKGHEWRSAISTRTSHQSGCPYCGGRRSGRK